MKNTLEDLTNHLYEQLERLNDDELMKDEESAKKEIKRASAIKDVSDQVIKIETIKNDKKRIQVDMVRVFVDNGYEITNEQQSKLFGVTNGNDVKKIA